MSRTVTGPEKVDEDKGLVELPGFAAVGDEGDIYIVRTYAVRNSDGTVGRRVRGRFRLPDGTPVRHIAGELYRIERASGDELIHRADQDGLL